MGQIVDAAHHRILSLSGPLAVAMTAKVRRYDVPVFLEFLCDPVPAAAMVSPAMNQNERRGVFVSPVDIVETEALRIETV